MPYRGSLRRCVDMMFSQFSQGNYERLAVICNPTGKYYTLLTMQELQTQAKKIEYGERNLCLVLTKQELNSMFKSPQSNMFKDN